MYSQTIANPNGTNEFFATLNPVTPGGPEYAGRRAHSWDGATGDNQNLITLRYDDTARTTVWRTRYNTPQSRGGE